MSVPFVATPIAPVRCVACPITPAKNEGRVAPIVTSMWPGRPALVDGATGGMSTRTVLLPTPSTKPLSAATSHAVFTARSEDDAPAQPAWYVYPAGKCRAPAR